MKEYFPFVFIINSIEYSCIWYSNEKDGFVSDDNKIKSFNSIEQLYSFIRQNNMNINDDKTILSIDKAKTWLKGEVKEIDCEYTLNFWNAVSDLSYSVGESFYGDNNNNNIVNDIYNKLFFGNNLPSLTPINEKYLPEWTGEEFDEIIKVVKDGLRIINLYIL